jgi:hypothetical protein
MLRSLLQLLLVFRLSPIGKTEARLSQRTSRKNQERQHRNQGHLQYISEHPHMFRLPSNHATRPTKNALGPDERAATSSTGIGMNHMSHQRGCKPVAKNSASDEQAIAAAHAKLSYFEYRQALLKFSLL